MESEELAERLPYFTAEISEEFQSIEAQIPPGTTTLQVGTLLKELLDELTVSGTTEPAEDLANRYVDEMLALDS
jgi:hypothetical protein